MVGWLARQSIGPNVSIKSDFDLLLQTETSFIGPPRTPLAQKLITSYSLVLFLSRNTLRFPKKFQESPKTSSFFRCLESRVILGLSLQPDEAILLRRRFLIANILGSFLPPPNLFPFLSSGSNSKPRKKMQQNFLITSSLLGRKIELSSQTVDRI